MENIIVIAGKKGAGKTYYAKKQIPKNGNLIIYDFNMEYGEFGETFSNILNFIKSNNNRKIFCPEDFFSSKNNFLNYLIYIKNCLILIDEFHLLSNQYERNILLNLIRLSRHKNNTFTFVTQRISDVHRVILSQADRFIFFKHTEKRDLDIIKDFSNFGLSEKVKNLPKYDYITFKQ